MGKRMRSLVLPDLVGFGPQLLGIPKAAHLEHFIWAGEWGLCG